MTALRFARAVVGCVVELVTGRLNGEPYGPSYLRSKCHCPACTPAKAELLEAQLKRERYLTLVK